MYPAAKGDLLMEERRIELCGGIVERRFYDEDGKLVEIRKEYPPDTDVGSLANFKIHHGSKGGHQF